MKRVAKVRADPLKEAGGQLRRARNTALDASAEGAQAVRTGISPVLPSSASKFSKTSSVPDFSTHKARMRELLDNGTRRPVTRMADRQPDLTFDENWILAWGVSGRPPAKLPPQAALRSGCPLTPEEQEAVTAFDNALAKLPIVEGPVVRHVRLTEDEIARYIPGRSITEPVWSSASTNPEGVNASIVRGTNVEFQLVSRTGRDYGRYGTPDEVLFRIDTTHFVHDKIKLPNGDYVIQTVEI